MKLEVKNICFAYHSKAVGAKAQHGPLVLNNVSFTLEDGEMVAFLGKNGAGKTTLLRIIPGFLPQISGEVLIDGVPVRTMSLQDKAKVIAYIPQFSHTAFAYTVKESVLMGRSPYISTFGKPSKQDEKRAEEVMEELGILQLKDRPTNEISGGERQLVLIARALMQNAKLLILDEPTSFLDYSNQLLVLEKATELTKKGYCCLYSTHNPDLALSYSSRVLAMKDGQVAFSVKPQELENCNALSSIYGRKLSVERTANGRLICVPQ